MYKTFRKVTFAKTNHYQENMIYGIFTGLVAGYIASLLQKGRGSGCLLNVVIGVIGGFIGGWVFSLLDITANGWIGEVVSGVIGACILLWILKLLK